MSKLINYSESLESISIELLRTEGKVRELILLQKSITEELDETEKMYIDKINECEAISRQQIEYMNELTELESELNGQVSNKRLTMSTISTVMPWKSSQHSQREERSIHSNNTTVDSKFLLHKNDPVNTLRWNIGLWIGGGIGTGNIIHSYHHPVHQRLELIAVGSGTIAIQYQKHDYMLQINYNDRRKKFHLLPKHLWTPDTQVTRCQFKTNHTACSTTFSLFERRHHCRKCGQIICQRHGLNRLPLFTRSSAIDTWCRVCDTCFHDLVVK
ncbi:hypothetical protein EDC94DRAFT_513164 [Helicostylum pulchrum]|nr:hypothetical protein EDC94DRAFT_513164 [Helicostylum pulchrum]